MEKIKSSADKNLQNEINRLNMSSNYRFMKLKRFVYSDAEDNIQKFTTIFSAIHSIDGNIVMILDSPTGDETDIYIGVQSFSKVSSISTQYMVLKTALEGNFPGSIFEEDDVVYDDIHTILKEAVNSYTALASVSGVANQRSKEKTEKKAFIQGIEKFIDSMKGQIYTTVIIADSISKNELENITRGYEELYSAINSSAKSVISTNINNSHAISKSLTKGTSESLSEGLTKTTSHTTGSFSSNSIGMSAGINSSRSQSVSKSTSKVKGKAAGEMVGAALGAVVGIAGTLIGGPIGPVVGGFVSKGLGSFISEKMARTITKTITNSISSGTSLGINAGHSWGTNVSDTISEAISEQKTKTVSEQETNGETDTIGRGTTLQVESVDKTITNLLDNIDKQIKRIIEGEAYGMFNCCAYFLSSKPETSIVAANTYRALIIGQDSSVETSAINYWEQEYIRENNMDVPNPYSKFSEMRKYLELFTHPIMYIPGNDKLDLVCTAASVVNAMELPIHLELPQKSVSGLPVLEQVPFGRNVQKIGIDKKRTNFDKKIALGHIYHMCSETNISVDLDIRSLSMHTFISGSTGSGKSNTVYHIINELDDKKVKYLIVEPAKGEYKYVLGGKALVYGTNPYETNLLRINPFSFPKKIHVLEHIDKLTELFNVCWPMYAAMPAVLKEAIEMAYREAGWDLVTSENEEAIFPTFVDVLDSLTIVVKKSAFSQEVKDNYTGALITRVKSLTNGINGQIFTGNEISADTLFDNNVIIDISRVGSSETKSLIMGIIVMKLQEYRIFSSNKMNEDLKHVTVLEEAHNLLKRTSTEQSSESSNLIGKSVEMLANSIAEMRTYGEGFIIVDQAPGLLDLSVIRNTNTKIIMRLPEESDRNLVGSSIGLSDKQKNELMKLKTGVGVVYQNDWIEAVMCSIPEYKNKHEYKFIQNKIKKNTSDIILGKTIDCILSRCAGEKVDNVKELTNNLMDADIPVKRKKQYCSLLELPVEKLDINKISDKIVEPFPILDILPLAKNADNYDEWNTIILQNMGNAIENISEQNRSIFLQCFWNNLANRETDLIDIKNKWIDYMVSKGDKLC